MWLTEEVKVYDKVKQVKLNMNDITKHLDVHCIFFYFHEQLRNIILENTNENYIKEVLQLIDEGDRTVINPFSICKEINNFNEINFFLRYI